MNNEIIGRILGNLTPVEQSELTDVLQSLHNVASEDGEVKPDGLNNIRGMVSPNVWNTLMQVHQLAGETRNKPFDPKMAPEDWADQLGLDANTLAAVRSTLDAGDVAYRLSEKMGRDQPDLSPPTMREHIAQAIDNDAPMAARRRFVEQALAGAGDHLSRRDAIKTIYDQKAKE